MLAAILNGKVSSRADNSEDLLTSVVFGSYEHLPFESGLGAFLRSTKGRAPLPSELFDSVAAEVRYWPWWKEEDAAPGAEPDVVLWLTDNQGVRRMVVVEAKRDSGMSGRGTNDQLARQAKNGLALARRTGARFVGIVYLTAHFMPPWNELASSQQAMVQHFGLVSAVPLWWASWREQREILRVASARKAQGIEEKLARDAGACLEKWGLEWFRGFSPAPSVPGYHFGRAQ